MTHALIAFGLFLTLFAVVGALSARASKHTPDDYLLAGRDVSPWLIGLSAVATNCSGYMFIGQIGLTYRIGLGSAWLAVGWILGDALVWWRFYRGVRSVSGASGARSVPGFLGSGKSSALTRLAGLLVLLFLGTYAAAQLQAGGKALHAVLGAPVGVGAALGAVTVLYYSYSGGLRASIWTDAAQSFVMLGSMTMMLVWAGYELGGPSALLARLHAIDPSLVDPFTGGDRLGFAPWALGWVGAGLGVIGQPTIIVRAMAIRSTEEIPRAARTYFAWFIPFYAATIALGLCARALLPDLVDPELAMPTLAVRLMPDAFVGVMLAGIFAATMSTADSQVLSCSAALVEDLFPKLATRRGAHKTATAVVTLFALAIALSSSSGVFALVLYSWSALGVTLGPLVAIRSLDRPLSSRVGVAMCIAGLAGLFGWRWAGMAASMYEIVPGAIAALSVYGFVSAIAAQKHATLS